ncbi:hypothetical protein ACFCX0_48140, partial [Streptomyces sp. NPDC056352]|uniref:hypothetical protein n=1 Tax=Streptomyces sp. NPDC056352 TaxID=3345791 RepID=UPI0035D882F6
MTQTISRMGSGERTVATRDGGHRGESRGPRLGGRLGRRAPLALLAHPLREPGRHHEQSVGILDR